MLECLILGDSIAAGTAQYRPECVSLAKVGITSGQWNNKYSNLDLSAKNVIISLGTNDHKQIKTREELEKIRNKVGRANVFWILPVGNSPHSGISLAEIQRIVFTVAQRYGDRILPISSVQKDRIHPTVKGYMELAHRSKVDHRG